MALFEMHGWTQIKQPTIAKKFIDNFNNREPQDKIQILKYLKPELLR